MSKTSKIRQLEKAVTRLEFENEKLIERNTALGLENHRLRGEIEHLALDLEVLRKAFDTPTILGDQAG